LYPRPLPFSHLRILVVVIVVAVVVSFRVFFLPWDQGSLSVLALHRLCNRLGSYSVSVSISVSVAVSLPLSLSLSLLLSHGSF
jgi:hypothetical protein